MPFERERRHTTQVVIDILNCSYSEARLPQSWKEADIAPVPKQTPADDVNKYLRQISLTPVLSKLTEDFVVDRHVKPAVLAKADPSLAPFPVQIPQKL